MIKTGVQLLTCDTPNQNGRIYPVREIEKALVDYQKRIDKQDAIGCWADDLASNGTMISTDITHIVTRAEIVGTNLVGDICIFPTPKGTILKNLIDDPDVQFGICCVGRLNHKTMCVSDIVIHSFSVFVESAGDKAKQHKATTNYNYDRAMGIVKK